VLKAQCDFEIGGDRLGQSADGFRCFQFLRIEVLRPAFSVGEGFDKENRDARLGAGGANGDCENHCGAGGLGEFRASLRICPERDDGRPADDRNFAAIGYLGGNRFGDSLVGRIEAGSVNERPAGRDDSKSISGNSLPHHEEGCGHDGQSDEPEHKQRWLSGWFGGGLRRGDGRRVGAFGKFYTERVGDSRAGIVLGQALTEAAGFDADDGIEARIIVVVAVEDFAAENVFFDFGGLPFDVRLDGELEKTAKAFGVDESGTGENGLQVLAEGGRIAHCIEFNGKIT